MHAAQFIVAGRLVAFPTCTSYGLAADTQQGWALQRLRNLKNRPADKTFTVFMREGLWDTFLVLREEERSLLKKMLGQPLTLLVRPAEDLHHLTQNGLIGLRIIDHPLMQALADVVDVPLTATSANRAGDPPCVSPAEIEQAFGSPVPDTYLHEENPRGASGTTYDLSLAAILDGGTLPHSQPTTIAQLINHNIKILRQGALTETEIHSKL